MSELDEQCFCTVIHENIVKKVSSALLDSQVIHQLADLYKIFGDATRLKILYALNCSEMCVCDLAACLGMTHSAISHQLRILKAYNLVKFRRQGKVVYYTLADDHVTALLHIGLEHLNE